MNKLKGSTKRDLDIATCEAFHTIQFRYKQGRKELLFVTGIRPTPIVSQTEAVTRKIPDKYRY